MFLRQQIDNKSKMILQHWMYLLLGFSLNANHTNKTWSAKAFSCAIRSTSKHVRVVGPRNAQFLPRSLKTSIFSSSTSSSSIQQINSISIRDCVADEIIDQYDAFILDQFGVLHNGVNALPGAVELVDYLTTIKKKKCIILSNTSAPSSHALKRISKFHYDSKWFIGAVTSGEASAQYIREIYPKASTKAKALLFTWDTEKEDNPRLTATHHDYFKQCESLIEVANTVEEADFLLLHGSEVWYRGDGKDGEAANVESLGSFIQDSDFEVIDPILQKCVERNLPMICANPDIVVQTPDGVDVNYMPGRIAQRYLELGADPDTCHVFGKPHAEHFLSCIQKLDMEKEKVVHVGDSLHHDIVGANAAGIDSIFVTSGIHAKQLQTTEYGEMPSIEMFRCLIENESQSSADSNVIPTHVVSAFRKM